jgi:demethylmenaquinone methyltransferase/2-methoxy-6-polyprenyl-1,4-benzoquinol methylase
VGEGGGLEALLAEQREFYDLRAPDYANGTRSARAASGDMSREMCRALVDDFAPAGDVLELACGPGAFTRELVRHARAVTAVDGSARMLERNRREVHDDRVTYVEADLFDWQPARTYDTVFFGFWLSHVPPARFDGFWALVRSCLRPGGRVAFVDEDARGTGNDDLRVVDGVQVATRTLRDGRRYDVVKLYWDPAELQDRLRALGWQATVRRAGDTFLYGTAT